MDTERLVMKHIKTVSVRVRSASTDITVGQVISVVAQLLTVVATAILAKEGTGK